jgi:hypothetical protein
MRYQNFFKGMMGIALTLLLLAGCIAQNETHVRESATPLPPTATPVPPAVNPQPGVSLVGAILMDNAKTTTISLKVSADGQNIESVGFATSELKCGGFSAGSISSSASGQYPILKGKITINSSGFGDITGRFTSPAKAEGSIHVIMSGGPTGSVDCGTWDWSAASE